jgi:threonine dehydrogenase-like Zn-dependent dehydrogenase
MPAERLVITAPNQLAMAPYDPGPPPAGEVRYRTLASLVSPGTETARFTGLQPSEYPYPLGYAAVGEVLQCGSNMTWLAPGDRVFTYGAHANEANSRLVTLPVPKGLAPERAVFARMAAVAMTAVRVSAVELGDWVAVLGLGLVGNFAAQLFQMAGAEVVGLDLCARRCELARACGVRHVIQAAADDGGVAEVRALTGGVGVNCAVEAVGYTPLVETACAMCAKRGEVVWVGSPRGEHLADLTPILQRVHLWEHGCLTFKGAHEWRYPTRPTDGCKHSITGNCRWLLDRIADGRLRVDPLLTHRPAPGDYQAAFEGLRDHKNDYLGVVFDWAGGRG